jgi:hypothetical protein
MEKQVVELAGRRELLLYSGNQSNSPESFKASAAKHLRAKNKLLSFPCRYSIDNSSACAQCDYGPWILQFT